MLTAVKAKTNVAYEWLRSMPKLRQYDVEKSQHVSVKHAEKTPRENGTVAAEADQPDAILPAGEELSIGLDDVKSTESLSSRIAGFLFGASKGEGAGSWEGSHHKVCCSSEQGRIKHRATLLLMMGYVVTLATVIVVALCGK